MNCHDARALVDAWLDNELDVLTQVQIDEHVASCASCSALYDARRAAQSALRGSGLYFQAPAGLERRIRGAARRRTFLRVPSSVWPGLALAAVLLLVVSVALLIRSREPGGEPRVEEVLAAHIRSLLPGHLTDVASSDQHTVKPWFAGRVDLSPPVPDLREQGFALIGGRLDYVGGRTVAVLVYQRNRHVLNVFLWPSTHESPNGRETLHGYNFVHWDRAGLACWVVSDLNAGELQQFVRLLERAIAR